MISPLHNALCDIGRRAYARALVAGTEGNLSCRLDDERLLCTPSGVCKGLLTPDDLCIVGPDGQQIEGRRARSSEILLHCAIYRAARAGSTPIGAVVHAHPPFATTFAVLSETIPAAVLPEAEIFLGNVPLVPYVTPGTPALGDAVAPYVAGGSAAILQNHGAVTWARDLETAYVLMETLEAVCRVVYQARAIGQVRPIPAGKIGELRAVRDQYRG